MANILTRFQPGFRLIDGSDLNAMIDQINAGAGPGAGVTYYCNETIGNDGSSNNGQNPYSPLKTVAQAVALESAALSAAGLSSVGRGSQIAFWGTQHQTAATAWTLPDTFLTGLTGTTKRGKRARFSVSGTTAFNNLFLVSGQGNQFSNFQTFFGFAVSTNAFTPWTDTGGRNCYDNCEFLGFGDSTVTTGTANLAGARSFILNTSNGETTWNNCVFGMDTIQRGAANYGLEIAGGAPRCEMNNCVFESDLAAGGSAGSHILIGVGGIDRRFNINNTKFMNFLGGTAMAQGLNIDVSAGGTVLLDAGCVFAGATAIQTTPTANVLTNTVAATTGGGKAHIVF